MILNAISASKCSGAFKHAEALNKAMNGTLADMMNLDFVYDIMPALPPPDAIIIHDCFSANYFAACSCKKIRVVHGVSTGNNELIKAEKPEITVAISRNCQDELMKVGVKSHFIRNPFEINNPSPSNEIKRAASIMQDGETIEMARSACKKLGIDFVHCFGKETGELENIIKESDIVFGIGRSLIDGMAMGKCAISLDKRVYNDRDYNGYGLITSENIEHAEICNFTGFNKKRLWTETDLIAEILKAKPEHGMQCHEYVKKHYAADAIAKQYLNLIAH